MPRLERLIRFAAALLVGMPAAYAAKVFPDFGWTIGFWTCVASVLIMRGKLVGWQK